MTKKSRATIGGPSHREPGLEVVSVPVVHGRAAIHGARAVHTNWGLIVAALRCGRKTIAEVCAQGTDLASVARIDARLDLISLSLVDRTLQAITQAHGESQSRANLPCVLNVTVISLG